MSHRSRKTPHQVANFHQRMGLRVILSRLASAEARAAAARVLAFLCAAGLVLTLAVMVATGTGLRRWFFVLLVWALFIYLPLRIMLEGFETIAAGLRRKLIAETAGQAGRYNSRTSVELVVDGLFERAVVMPRITGPAQGAKAREGAVAALLQVGGENAAGLHRAALGCLATVDRWVTDLSGWSQREAGENIQARWSEVRALAALAALTKVLIAAYEDRSKAPLVIRTADGSRADGYLDSCLDSCDQLALEVDVVPWTEAPLAIEMPAGRSGEIRRAWKTFCETGSPALEARKAFVDVLITKG